MILRLLFDIKTLYTDTIWNEKNLPLWIYETLIDPCEKPKVAYFTSSRLKKIPVSFVKSKFTIKIFYCIALGSKITEISL